MEGAQLSGPASQDTAPRDSRTTPGQRARKKMPLSSQAASGGFGLQDSQGDSVLEHRASLAGTPNASGQQEYSKNAQSQPLLQPSQTPQEGTAMLKTGSNQSPNQALIRLGCGGKSVLPRNISAASSTFCGSGGPSSQLSRHKAQNAFQFHSGVLPSQFVSRRGPLSKTSPYRGVSCYKRTGRWEAHIWHDGRQVHLGTYSTPREAACIYDIAAIQLRGWGADLNFDIDCYKDDPLLREPICMPGSNLKSADVVKLVQGLKSRRGHPYQGVARSDQDMVCLHLEMPEPHSPQNQDIGSFAPAQRLGPRFCVASSPNQTDGPSGKYIEQSVDTSRMHDRNFGYSVEILQQDQHAPPAVNGAVLYPAADRNSHFPNSSCSTRIPHRRSGVCYRDNCVSVSSVMPSKVISMGGHQHTNSPRLVQRACSGRGFDSQIVFDPTCPKVSLVAGGLDNPVELPSSRILEGKPILQGPTAPSIGADWDSINRVIPTTVGNDGLLHVQYVGACAHGDFQRENEVPHNNVPTIPSGEAASLNRRLHTFTSVLQVTGQDSDAYCKRYPYHRKEITHDDEIHHGSASGDARPSSVCSRDRFPRLLQLIRDLPATKLVRPLDRTGKNFPDPTQEGEKPFDGENKLRSGSSHGSAFKTWTNHGDGQGRSHSDLCRCWQSQRKSGQSTDSLSDVNNRESFVQNESQSLSEQSGNVQKANGTERSPIDPECRSDLSGSDADGGPYNHVRHDDLLAAQELCRLSRMCNQSPQQGGVAPRKQKRPCTTSDEPHSIKSWQRKKLRTVTVRDSHPGSTAHDPRVWGSKSFCKDNHLHRRFGLRRNTTGRRVRDSTREIRSLGYLGGNVKNLDDELLRGFRTNLQKERLTSF